MADVGYRFVGCAFDYCDWQAVDGSDQRGFRHLIDDHEEELRQLWRLGVAEQV